MLNVKTIKRTFAILIAVIFTTVNLYAQTTAEKIDHYIQAHVANKRFSGTVFIAKGDDIIYHKSFGLANQSLEIKNSNQTKYLIGSITKPFTAYAILLLEKAGKLSLKDKLISYFPSYPNAENITIEQLVTHTAGIPDYHMLKNWKHEGQKRNLQPENTIEEISKLPARFIPGSRFEYSNSGYILLGLIIEKVSNRSFASFINEHISKPLGLRETGVMKNETWIKKLALGYNTSPKESKAAEYINYQQPFSSGNMYSIPQDLWVFTKAVVQSKLIPAYKTKDIFQKNTGQYGYGWGIRKHEDSQYYGHHGGMNGFVGSISYLPKEDYFICFLKNDENAPWYSLANDLVSIVQGEDIKQPDKETLIPISDKTINNITGNYLIKTGDTLKIYYNGKDLFMQETGQLSHQLFPIENNKFVCTKLEFYIQFSSMKTPSEWLMFNGGVNLKAKRIY